ncbi:MAG: twin-arginine translocation signal domain-containing protein [Pseudomonadota bacterium]
MTKQNDSISETVTDMLSDFNVSRRDLLRGGAAVTAAATTGVVGSTSASAMGPLAGQVFGQNPAQRRNAARNLRRNSANRNRLQFPLVSQTNNGDETLYADRRGSYSKSLLHNEFGEVDAASFDSFLVALDSRDPADFENIIVGNATDTDRVRLVSPQAAFSFDQSGVDSNGYRMPNAPAFASAETAAEMGELYWYALTRDVPFLAYEDRNIIQRASDDLNAFSRSDIFLQDGGAVTPGTIFRGTITGNGIGPFVSQFLYQPFFFGRLEVEQRYDRPVKGAINDFMTDYDEWLGIQNGAAPSESTTFSGKKRFIATMRDLGEFVHVDFPIQSPLYAFLICLGFGPDARDPNLPHTMFDQSATQQPFVSFAEGGLPHLVMQGPRIGLLGAWFQKWAAHRRLRPEVYAGRINNMLRGRRVYDINQEILDSDALARTIAATESDVATNQGLLPMGFPEGSPAHPAYPGGHSTFAAAGATLCKAIFDEDFVIPNPVQSNNSGTQLIPWGGEDLTIGNELNKLVGNITHGRDGAGMHWRSDGRGNFIGEDVAISLLQDYSVTYNDAFDGFQLTRFDGTRIRIVNGQVLPN